MLIIKKQQMEALEVVPLQTFKNDIFDYLGGAFYVDCKILGESQIRKVIDIGIERANYHGFQTRGDVCDYIVLMFILGSFFDADLQLPWMQDLLEDNNKEPPTCSMEVLYGRTADYVKQVAGVNGEHYKNALLKSREMPFKYFAEVHTENLLPAMRSVFSTIYKQKYEQLSETILNGIKHHGQECASKYGLATREGILIYVCLMFMLGTYFDKDPLYPWAADVLRDELIKDPLLKAHKLHERAVDHLEKYLRTDASSGRV